jgi:FlaA1/EpsC-like NDP-sugar epimerase
MPLLFSQRSIASLWLKAAARNRRVLLVDAAALLLSVYLGYALRLTLRIESGFRDDLLRAVAAFVPSTLLCLYAGGIYRIHWPQASVEEYVRLSRWYAGGCALFLLIDRFWPDLVVPRTSLAILMGAGLLFLGAIRASWRLARVGQEGAGGRREPALIVGAGEAGAQIARDLLRHGSGPLPAGFVDDDPDKRGKIVAGLPVLGSTAELSRLAAARGIRTLLVALPDAPGSAIRRIVEEARAAGTEVRVLPSLRELADGRATVSRLRRVGLEDLLRREPIRLDLEGIDGAVRGRTVLVTGAGGSIGSEIVRQLLDHGPRELLLVGHGEQSLYRLGEELRERRTSVPFRPLVADTADDRAMEEIFRENRPELVFHAAAHKHVPLMEEAPREALRVNGRGTWTVARLAGEQGAERMVMISTDKAVRPSSIMGASKRLAERLLETAQRRNPGTAYMAVRFGNVLGSRGSVVPKFEEQILRGGPLTVTHPEMRRYFMLIPEAVSLVLQAGSMGEGGELYVLDMGEPVRIVEMAETLIRLHGHEPYSEIPIVFTGIRPGEKLFEELFFDPDHVDRTAHEKIFRTRFRNGADDALPDQVEELLRRASPQTIREALFRLAEEPESR